MSFRRGFQSSSVRSLKLLTAPSPRPPLFEYYLIVCPPFQESPQFPAEKEGGCGGVGAVSPPGFNSAQESKAAKVATLSQALGYVDQYR